MAIRGGLEPRPRMSAAAATEPRGQRSGGLNRALNRSSTSLPRSDHADHGRASRSGLRDLWLMPRASPGGRQRLLSDYDPTLKNRSRAAQLPFLRPVVLSPPCRPPSTALCWRSHLSRSCSAALAYLAGWRVLPPRRPGRRDTVRPRRFRGQPSVSARRRSHSRRSGSRIAGEARPPLVSTAPGSSTGRTGD